MNEKDSSKESDVTVSGSQNITIAGDVRGTIITGDGNVIGDHSVSRIVKSRNATKTKFNTSKLLDLLLSRFSIHDISVLSFELNIDYDSVTGTNKRQKVANLIELLERQGRLYQLVNVIEETRPDISLDRIIEN